MNDLNEIGYLAGILDAEGSISLKRTRRKNVNSDTFTYEPIVTIGMKYSTILQKFADRYSGSIRNSDSEKLYRYARSGIMGVKDILNELIPFLIEKKERGKLLLEYINVINLKEKNRSNNGRIIPYIESEMNKREIYYLKMKELNAIKTFPYETETVFDNDDILIGYLAGIVDGEGCFRINKIKPSGNNNRTNPGYTASFSLGMRDKRILDLFKNRYGGTLSEERKNGKLSGLHRYKLTGNVQILPLLNEITLMLIEKQERAEVIIEYINSIDSNRKVSDNGTFISMSDQQLKLREHYFLKLKKLNGSKKETDNRFYDNNLEKQIVKLFQVDKLPLKDIADILNCDQQKVYNTLIFNKIKVTIRNRPRLGKYNFEEALEWDRLHNHEGLSVRRIAMKFFNDERKSRVVSNCLKRFGFNVRSEDKSSTKWTKEIAMEWYKLYTSEGYSIRKIAIKFGIQPTIVSRVLKRNGYIIQLKKT